MPRKSATQVSQAVSRMLEAGYLKSVPAFYPVLLNHPPTPVPPRSPRVRTFDDMPESIVRRERESQKIIDGTAGQRSGQTMKQLKSRIPSLNPKPIVYLEDKVRKQFFMDHPWEGLKPRQIVEKEKLDKPKVAPQEVTELTWWSRNPQPEDVVAHSVHLHKNHEMSLSAAYLHALSQYHSIKAEREYAARYAVLEAKAWGGSFTRDNNSADYLARYEIPPGSDKPLNMRAFDREEDAMDTWGRAARGASGSADGSAAGKATSKATRRVVFSGGFSGGEGYQKPANAIHHGNTQAFAATHRKTRSSRGAAADGNETSRWARSSPSSSTSRGGAVDSDNRAGLQTWAVRSSEMARAGAGGAGNAAAAETVSPRAAR